MALNKQFTRRSALVAGATGVAGTAAAVGLTAGSGAALSGCSTGNCKEWDDKHKPKAVTGPSTVEGRRVLATLADIPVGGSVTARTPDGEPIIISRPTDTTAVAFSAKCTHKGCVVNPNGKRLHCPPHDGYFAADTGEAQDGPPKKPLARVEVSVADGKVVMAA